MAVVDMIIQTAPIILNAMICPRLPIPSENLKDLPHLVAVRISPAQENISLKNPFFINLF
jgi:hypothetical protein